VFGSTERKTLDIKNVNPGPGQYLANGKNPDGPKFSLGGKYERKNNQQTPGPGHY